MTDDDNSDRRQTIFDADRAAQPLNQNVDLPSTVEEEAKQYNKENFAPAIANDKRLGGVERSSNIKAECGDHSCAGGNGAIPVCH